MLDLGEIAPTRSKLMELRARLQLAREGHDLLDKKRHVLIGQILRTIADTEQVQKEMEERFRRAYETVEEARAAMGTERVSRIALSSPRSVEMRITPHSIMGVLVPTVHYKVPERRPLYGFGDTSPILDQVRQEWLGVLDLLGEFAEKVTTVWRLALELRKTQRRVNALENVFIPAYEAKVKYIEETLEEKEREDLFRMKRTKGKLSQGAGL
ncbi:MAG: V-type ATP synthase subunit D [Chloroflexi bacterium]|nr:V-type ATP synthase subunit D [Chloroflexota bacterium]